MIAEWASKLWWRRTLRREARSWEELDQFPLFPAQRQRRILAERLLAQLQYFGHREDALPEWREAAEIRDPEELWGVWPSLPIVDKRTLQSRFEPVEIQERFRLQGVVRSTGGSTGEPTAFFYDPLMVRTTRAQSVYARMRMGWRPGMATVVVWGSERDIGRQTRLRARLRNHLLRTFLIDGYNLTQQTVERVLEVIRRHRPVALYGFTSMLEFVAQKTLELRGSPPPGSVRTAWNGGEMLFEQQNAVFRKAFGVAMLNCYSGRELSTMACQFHEAQPLLILRPWLFLEVVDSRGRPAGPGESGRLLWTSTVCRGTPFLRYDVGDLGAFESADQNESGIFALRELHGRVGGLLRLPDGKTVNCLYWNHLFKEFSEVQQFQVVLKKDGRLQFLLKGRGFTLPRETELRTALKDFLGGLSVQISWVDNIPLTSQGKLMQVVNEDAGISVPHHVPLDLNAVKG